MSLIRAVTLVISLQMVNKLCIIVIGPPLVEAYYI